MENNRINDEKLMELQGDIEKWKKTYPQGVTLISLSPEPFDGIFKVPSLELMKMASKQESDLDKNRQLVLDCVLYPKIEVFHKILDEKPGIVVPIATKLVETAGVLQEATVKKL